MTQESFSSRRHNDAPQESEQIQVNTTGQSAGVDDLLDEIDSVLESNAEEFVRGFVQKGGQ